MCNTESSLQDCPRFHSVLILDLLTSREHSNKIFNNQDNIAGTSVQKKGILMNKNSIYCDNLSAGVVPRLTRVFIIAATFS